MSHPLPVRGRPVPAFLAFLGLLGLSAFLAPAPRPAAADDVPPSAEEEERLDEIARHTERALKAFRSGNHEEVMARMKRLTKYDPKSRLVPFLTARVHERVGEYEQALDVATAAAATFPDDRRIEAARFKVLLVTGKHDVATLAARAALEARPNDLVARGVLAETLEERGQRKEALAEYDKIIQAYNTSTPDASEIPWVAKAAVRATWLSENPADDMLPGAVKLVQRYLVEHPEDLDVKLQLAELFRADRGSTGQATANKYYSRATRSRSSSAPSTRTRASPTRTRSRPPSTSATGTTRRRRSTSTRRWP
jgi:tetratricopeptide (TPR) repeat protein